MQRLAVTPVSQLRGTVRVHRRRASTAHVLVASIVFVMALPGLAGAQETVTVYVATNGLDTNPGTHEAPVATIGKAIGLAERQPAPAEVVVRGGTYFLERTVTIRRSKKASRLVIRSADNETAVFDASIPVDEAEPLEGAPGVYLVKGEFPSDEPPPVWEENTGRRFSKLAGLDSVQRQDYSSVVLDENTLALRCRGGIAPAAAGIRTSRSGLLYCFIILRDDVTVKGIEFRNFVLNSAGSAMRIGPGGKIDTQTEYKDRTETMAANTVIDSCSTWNCHKGLHVYTGSANALLTRCRIRNSVTGVWVSGVDSIVEHCAMVNDPDWLLTKIRGGASPSEQCGVRMYNYCVRATIRGNLIKGFRAGIHCKNGWGAFAIEHNTVIYGLPRWKGIVARAMRPNMNKDYHVRYNVFAGFDGPFTDAGVIPADADIDYNVFWGPEFNCTGTLRSFQAKGVGLHNVYADPLFSAPGQDDYRLLPGSPALNIHGSRTAGAFPQVPANSKAPPNLRATLVHKKGVQTRDTYPPPHLPRFSTYVSSQREVDVALAVSSISPVGKMRFRIDDRPLQEREFKASDTVELPDRNGWHTIHFQVRDANGAWSEESVIYVALRRGGVQLLGGPALMTGRYGALFCLKTDRYAWGKLECYADGQWVEAANSAGLPANSDGFPEDYGEYREFSSLPLLAAGLAPDTPHRYRLTVSTPLDSTVNEGSFTLSGRPKIMYVSTEGEDVETGGSRQKPLRTIQFALDRALPADRVRILPGVYFGAHILNHGGTAERPLVIEGLYPNTVTLDGLREVASCLRLDHAPHVVLRNLNFRWFKYTGISANNSAGIHVTSCRFHNQYWRTASWAVGTSILLWRSPNFIIDRCIFSGGHNGGLVFDESSGGQILHNTATACAVMLVYWRGWWQPSDNVTIKYNSFNWNGNQMLNIQQPRATLRHKCALDFNNYGTTFMREEGTVIAGNRKYGRSVPKPFRYLPSNREFMVYTEQDQTDPVLAAKPRGERTRVFVNMEDWVAFSGQDKNSIFADPKWIDPQAGRFDVAADSPNLLPDGKVIGALGYLGENPNMEPEVVITSPYSGEEITGAFTVAADASDFDGTVQRVEFHAAGRRLGEAVTPPYRLAGVTLAPGDHVITARAVDDRGGERASDQVRVTALE